MPALTWTRRWALLAQAVLLAVPLRAGAADRVQECIGEHVEAQLLRNRGRLLAARARLAECATPTCPALVRDECQALRREVDAALPSVVLGALDEHGQPTAEPLVSIDGAPLPVALDGRPIPLDPGEHRLRFRHPAGELREVRLVLAESERDRRVVADFRSMPHRATRPGADGWTKVTLASAGVAALALGGFTYFALSGRAAQSELERCKPSCESRDDVDRMRSRYLMADISLGLALVSLGVGAYAWVQRPAEPSSLDSRGARRTGLRLQPVATHRHIGLWATGAF